jgi:hypothetical protein
MLTTLFFLLSLHFLADFPLQGSYLAENKGKDDYLLLAHSFIWAGTISAGLIYFGIFTTWKAAFLLIGHFCIDRVKARGLTTKYLTNQQALYVDQLLHFIQLVIIII